MQHTLLPTPERIIIRHEYHVRVWILALFAISVAGTIGVAALFPSYLRGSLEERLQLEAIANLQKSKDASGIANIEQELVTDKLLLAALTEGTDKVLLSTEISDILDKRGIVKVTSISISHPDKGGTDVTLLGVAPTRESLTRFKDRLETENPPGTEVNLPISQLAKSTNIQFSMQIIKPKI